MKRILITGATGAIGAALARQYAAPGYTLLLQGRDPQRLTAVAADCRRQGAQVLPVQLDLTDRVALSDWLGQLLREGVPDLVIANAGMNTHAKADDALESWEATEQLLELNIRSTFYLVHRCATAMQTRGSGQLVMIGSLAGWFGLPVTPGYSASKAAIKVYAEALRGALWRSGVKVTLVMPGYVHSPMCKAMPGPKPWLWSAERAAAHIARKLRHAPARISFPFPLNWGGWWLAVLPAAVSHRIVYWLGYGR
jgi:short-subunit dehydrogenase